METTNSLFPKGDRAPVDYFTGIAWLKGLSNDPAFNVVISDVRFEPGTRTNWHTHPGGQILLVTDGVCCYQEKGKPVQEFPQGSVIMIPAELEHWHGALPDKAMTHIAINTQADKGAVEWLQPVTDAEYRSSAQS